MKLAAAAAALATAGLVASPPAASASQVAKTVKVVGSDNGACKSPFLEEGPGCDASFVLVAREFADGTVKGQLTDVNKFDVDGVAQNRGSVECVRIYEDASRDYTVAVVAGMWDVDVDGASVGQFEAGDTWWTFAAIDGEGTPYYTSWLPAFGPFSDFTPTDICDDAEEAAGFLLQAGFFFEHLTGQVTIDKLACEDLRSEKKCGKFVRQCKWDEEEEACVELGICERARTQTECRALGFECRWDGEEEACDEQSVGCPTSCSSNEDCCSGACLSNGECLKEVLPAASQKVEYATAAKEPHSAGATAKVSMLVIVPAIVLWLLD